MKKISSRDYLAGLRIHLLPFVVWVGAIACVVVLFSHRSKRYEILGVAQAPMYQIAANCDGRLISVSVELFDEVKEGQVLAVVNGVLDNEPTRAELLAEVAALKAEAAHLTAAARATRATESAQIDRGRAEWVADSRAFADKVADLRLRVLELRTAIETDKLTVQQLDFTYKRFIVEGRADVNDVALFELQALKAERDAMAKQVEQNERMLEQAELERQAAIERQQQFANNQAIPVGPTEEAAQDVINKQTEVLERQVDVFLAQLASLGRREAVELRSPVDGIVVPIHGNANEVTLQRAGENLMRRAGEVVAAGDPIFAVVEVQPREVVAYVNERELGGVREGIVVELVKNTEPPQIAKSQVTYVSPVVEQIPERLWLNPAIPQWGRPVVIEIPSGMRVISGELVGVRGI
jgi:multidrug resistance efflux pump